MRSRGPGRDAGHHVAHRLGAARPAAAGTTRRSSGRCAATQAANLLRLGRLRRRAKAVQVEQVRDRRAGAALGAAHAAARPGGASASSSFSWMPPKPPLLMHRTWSPEPRRGDDAADQLGDRRRDDGARAHRRERLRRVPAQAAGVAERQVGLLERPRQLRLHRAELHRVRARLEDGEDARARRPCWRRPSIVVRIAVGWCAKSS